MGKRQHSKDRLFVTATEWKYEGGGKKVHLKTVCGDREIERIDSGDTIFDVSVCLVVHIDSRSVGCRLITARWV